MPPGPFRHVESARSGSFTNELLGLSVRARIVLSLCSVSSKPGGESRDLLRVTHLTAKTAGRLEYGKLYGLEGEPSCRHRVGRRIPGAVGQAQPKTRTRTRGR